MKPVNQAGMFCPLMRGLCKDHCHECEFWQPMYQTAGSHEKTLYNCVFVWNMHLTGINNARIDGMQKATESMRNEFGNFHKGLTELTQALFSLAQSRAAPIPLKDVSNG